MVKIPNTPICEELADCRRCDMRDIALFSDLGEDDFALINHPIPQREFDVGSAIYISGEVGNKIFTIRKGVIKLVHHKTNGSQRIVRLLRQGSVAGLEALIGSPYEHTAVAMEPASVCEISAEDVNRLDRETPNLHQQLMERWHTTVQDADRWITAMSTGNAKIRMAHLFLYLVAEARNDCRLFSREEVGAILGLTPETASHTISDFKRTGVVTQTSQNRFDCDVMALRLITESMTSD